MFSYITHVGTLVDYNKYHGCSSTMTKTWFDLYLDNDEDATDCKVLYEHSQISGNKRLETPLIIVSISSVINNISYNHHQYNKSPRQQVTTVINIIWHNCHHT